MPIMMNDAGVYLTAERYEALVKAERERDALFCLLKTRCADYGRLDREHLVLLCDLFDIKEPQNEEL